MKIISIIRRTHNLDIPDVFTVGEAPSINGQPIEGPIVNSIKFQETGFSKSQAYRGPCYIIAFAESNVRRVIPADNIVDIAVEVTVKKAEGPDVPE